MAIPRISIESLSGLKPKYANFVIEYCKDFAARRAAEASGFSGDSGHALLNREEIQDAIQRVITSRLKSSEIDAEWALMEAVDNHSIARQQGNITASNSALKLIFGHVSVDANAVKRMDVDVGSHTEIVERLKRGRQRIARVTGEVAPEALNEPSFI